MKKLRPVSSFLAGAAAVALCGGIGIGAAVLTGGDARADEAPTWAVPTDFPVQPVKPVANPDKPAANLADVEAAGGAESYVPADEFAPGAGLPLIQAPLPEADLSELDENVTDLATDWPTAWDRIEKVDDHSIRAYFRTGSEACFGAYGTVSETPERVIITVHTGVKKNAPAACTMNLRGGSVLVHTDAAIGDRAIVDGALPQPK